MRIWFPTIRVGSGSDVYVDRLVSGLRAHGVDACLQWFDHTFEFVPFLLHRVRAPRGTDLIHANSWNGFAFAREGIPLVVTAFHCVFRCGYPEWKTLAQRMYHDGLIGRYERRSFARASRVVAMTPSAAADFGSQFSLPTLHVIHGWVDTNVFCEGTTRKFGDGGIRILIVGNNSRRKGMDLLPKLRSRLNSRFLITVVGGLRGTRGDVASGIIHKSGLSVMELVNEYQAADLVVSLSRHEGFGYSALEAMACAKPVVAFDTTGIRDVVVNGATGILVRQESIGELAGVCERISEQPLVAMQMGAKGRKLALTKFSERNAVASYLKLYQDVISRSHGTRSRPTPAGPNDIGKSFA